MKKISPALRLYCFPARRSFAFSAYNDMNFIHYVEFILGQGLRRRFVNKMYRIDDLVCLRIWNKFANIEAVHKFPSMNLYYKN